MRISDWSSDVCSSDLDVDAYHRERRRDEADHRITAASWNRAVASLDRLYRWGEQQGLIADAPFSRRAVWRTAQGGRRGMIAARNDAYESVAKRSDVRFVTQDVYHILLACERVRESGGTRRCKDDKRSVVSLS